MLKYAGAETDPMYAYMNDGGAFLQNRQMVMQMMNPNQGQVDENGNPIDDGSGGGGQVDENGNPVEGGGDEAPAYGDGSEEGDAGEGEAPPQDEAGKEEAPPEGEEEAPEGGDEEKSAVDAAVIEYLKEHPELQKSLAKSEDAKEANARLEGIREDYLKTYQLVQKKMLAEILGELKEELSDEPDTDSSKN